MPTVLLLIASNLFMTVAWYGHLKFKGVPYWQAILVSWGIAFFEYCLQVPANRLGDGQFDKFQLKIIQEVISIVLFVGFAMFYFKVTPRWNHLVSFGLILVAVYFAFLPRPVAPGENPLPAERTAPRSR